MSKHKRKDKVMTEKDKKNKRNTSLDEPNYRSQAGQPMDKVTGEDSGGQYNFEQDRLGKMEGRNKGKGEKAPDISTPNVEGGAGGSVYEKGNRTPYASKSKKPRNK